MDAVAAVERQLLAEKHGESNPRADAAVDSIVNRWKVRYHLSHVSEPVSTCIQAPDIRGSYQRLRAELLQADRKIVAQPTIEDELTDALKELSTTRQTVHHLQEENRAASEALQAERARSETLSAQLQHTEALVKEHAAVIETLRRELAEQQAALSSSLQRPRGASFRRQLPGGESPAAPLSTAASFSVADTSASSPKSLPPTRRMGALHLSKSPARLPQSASSSRAAQSTTPTPNSPRTRRPLV